MAKLAKSAWDAYVNAEITTNGVQHITGAIMNKALRDLSDSILWGDYVISKNNVISATGSTIVFPAPLANNNYTLVCRTFDATGQAVGYTVDPLSMSITGFHITPAVDGLLDYIVITHI